MITDLLLDVNIIVDVCAERHPYFARSVKALDKAIGEGVRLWIYTGSVQTLEYVTANELRRAHLESNTPITVDQAHKLARKILALFSKDRHWLTALPEDGMVFEEEDPEDAQLHRAVTRLGKGARLLTRDEETLKSCPQAISPGDYLDYTSKGTQIPFIDLAAQQDRIRPNLEKNIFAVIRHGLYILGPEVQELEEKLSSYTGARHTITCSSGTDALLMALMAYDVGPGDAVFTTPFTFIATAEAISFLGATPVFVDIDPRTFNIDPNQLELGIEALMSNNPSIHPLPSALSFEPSALSPKGIITVDLFGLPADYDPINPIAREYGLFVIEDAAQSFGADYHGKKACTLAGIGCTSFFPAKPLGCYGDGGAVFTDDDDLAEKMRSIRVHGKGSDKYDNIRIGMNARMDTLQAAILLAKMEIYPREIQLRQEVAKRYTDLLSTQCSALSTPFIPEGMKSAWAQYSLLARDQNLRARIQAQFKDAGIPTMVYYPTPLHMQRAFAYLGYNPEDFPVSLDTSTRILNLPMHPYVKDWELDRILTILKEVERI
ncbi:MAG: aminotransferase class I/II-fold pyridoxal phosphate-dependent enzyme [Deltaproteobacteria bacterium]|nr:aminotransferase class I/II-fold pyridoxal phosphate-dependent enzyme [Deltaproteobacteria bacterium]